MALDIFNPPKQPSVNAGAGTDVEPRILVSKLGDGNSQRVADGLNDLPAMLTLVWDPIHWADAETIEAFLNEHRGGVAFLYKPVNETRTRAWYWTKRQRVPSMTIAERMTVSLEECFDY
jgi:phage-related protein